MIAGPGNFRSRSHATKIINACRNKSSVFVEVNFPLTFKSLVGGLFFNRITSYVRFLYPADGNSDVK
jgi:hypothetical protein